MKRFCQGLFNALAAISLLLSLATAGLSIHSHWIADYLLWRSEGYASVSLSAYRGSLDIMRAKSVPDHFEFLHVPVAQARTPVWAMGSELKWTTMGFAIYAGPEIQHGFMDHIGERPIPYTEIVLPIWSFLLIFAIPPLLRWRQYRASRRRANPTLCTTCGYDLRATPDRCPECGTIPQNHPKLIRSI